MAQLTRCTILEKEIPALCLQNIGFKLEIQRRVRHYCVLMNKRIVIFSYLLLGMVCRFMVPPIYTIHTHTYTNTYICLCIYGHMEHTDLPSMLNSFKHYQVSQAQKILSFHIYNSMKVCNSFKKTVTSVDRCLSYKP